MTDPAGGLTPRDTEQLRMLVIGHYVVAGIQAAMGCLGIFHLGMGVLIVASPDNRVGRGAQADPAWVGWLFIGMAVTFMAISWSLAVALLLGARRLARRRGYLFCLVVAFFAAILSMPLGTALGACTLIVLLRPSVKAAFEADG